MRGHEKHLYILNKHRGNFREYKESAMKMRSLLMIPGMVFVLMGCTLLDPGPGGPSDPDPITDPAVEPEPVLFGAPVIQVITDNADGIADFQAEIIITNRDTNATHQWSTNEGIDWNNGNGLMVYAESRVLARSVSTSGEISEQSTAQVQFYQAPAYQDAWYVPRTVENAVDQPYGIDLQGGEVYVAGLFSSAITVFDSNGNILRSWSSYGTEDGQLNYPHGISLYQDRLYVADTENQRVVVFDLQGNFLLKWGTKGSGSGEFKNPYDIFVSRDEVFVTDFYNSRVQVFDTNGNYLRQWGTYGQGTGQFLFITGVAVQGERVYLCDRINSRVQVFDRMGQYQTSITGIYNPLDIVLYHDRIYISQYNNYISVYSGDHRFLSSWGSAGRETGQFDFPAGIAIGDNSVYITDSKNSRVQKFAW